MEVTWKDVLSSIDIKPVDGDGNPSEELSVSDFTVPRSDISPQQTRNGGICRACNS